MNNLQKAKQQKLRSKVDVNCQKFYKQHPDLAPRNIYLHMGRILKLEDVQKAFFNWDKPWWQRYLDKIIGILRK